MAEPARAETLGRRLGELLAQGLQNRSAKYLEFGLAVAEEGGIGGSFHIELSPRQGQYPEIKFFPGPAEVIVKYGT